MMNVLMLSVALAFTSSLAVDAEKVIENTAQKVMHTMSSSIDRVREGGDAIKNDVLTANRKVSQVMTKKSVKMRRLIRDKLAKSERKGRHYRNTVKQFSNQSADQLYRLSQGLDNEFNHFVENMSYIRLR